MRCWWIIWSVDLLQSLPHRMMRFSATNLQSSIVSLMEVSNELKGHRGDQRRALTTLYDHPNMQAQLQAAKLTLAVAPDEARRKIESIASSGWLPQSGDAGMCLFNLDRGIFKPT